MSSLKWNGEKVKRDINATMRRNVDSASQFLAVKLKQTIGIPGSKGFSRSKPGEPPHKDKGRLRASISYEIASDGKSAKVGTNVKYGKMLEFGTKKMAARPWLRPTFNKCLAEIKKILGRKR